MASETKPTVLDLWVCPDCKRCRWPDYLDVDGPPECDHGTFYEESDLMVRRRALVLDDTAVEAAAANTYRARPPSPRMRAWADLPENTKNYYRLRARAVLGMEEET